MVWTVTNYTGYKFDSGKINCNNIGVSPNNEKDKSLFPMEFLITDTEKDGVRLAKVATPSSNRSFLNSCKGWAGKDCTLSAARKAEFAELAALAKKKSKFLNYNK